MATELSLGCAIQVGEVRQPDEEEQTVNDLGEMLKGITTETLHFQSEAEYIESGCAERIKPVAQEALKLFLTRGRFSEDYEELTPALDPSQA
ncbi:hypothetical protein [Rhizobium ruizarguesonis]|uniref:hypothetical protein n=1 Tax=Rhizobium ruizarguesonis TaxID=2081791 RepID=UPI001FEE3B65|nr:hypothetical protein [Rhizobium ruizarguesonis]